MKLIFILCILALVGMQQVNAQTPTLGTYPATTVIAGQNITVTPSVAPGSATSITAYTNTNFTGVLTLSPTTGVVSITDAKQAGTYPITVKAFNGTNTTTSTFNLTVTNPNCSQGLFSGISGNTNVTVGVEPRAVAVGEFNGDGIQDIAVVNYQSFNISIRLGNGLGGFNGTTDVSFGTSYLSNCLIVGDFNGDGKQDIAVPSYVTNKIYIRLGDGLGGFSGTTSITVGSSPQGIASGDFNGDGKLDIAVANAGSNNVSILIGDGLGGFTSTTNVAVGTYPWNVVVGDFNGDSNQDIAVPCVGSGIIYIRLGDGLGGFSGNTNLAIGNNSIVGAVGDFNNDSKQDIAIVNQSSNSVSIRLGDGLGGFSGNTNVTVGTGPESIAIGDFNGDGNQDFAAANQSSNTVSIRLGDGLGGFYGTTNVSVSSNPIGISVGDFNGDGRQDFVTCSNNIYNSVNVRLGAAEVVNMNVLGLNAQGILTNIYPIVNAYGGATDYTTDFGYFCHGMSPSVTKTYTIQNTGSTSFTLNAGSITISKDSFLIGGALYDSLFVLGGITFPTVVPPNSSSTTFTVTFHPNGWGFASAQININPVGYCGTMATYKHAIGAHINIPSNTSVSVCSNALPYSWNGTNYDSSGYYLYTTTGSMGCDSFAYLFLTVKPASTSSTTSSVCSSALPYTWNGTNYNTAGTYTFTTTNSVGCDSVATLVLTLKPASTSSTSENVCSNTLPYTWNGTNYNATGVYTYNTTNAAGCDSVATLNLTVNNPNTSSTNISVCSNSLPYVWNGNSYNTSGTHTLHFTNAGGCDSAVTLNLTVNTATNNSSSVTACNSYTWNANNQTYTTSGTYQVVTGCHTETLNLTINSGPTVTAPANMTVCTGTSVTLSGGGAVSYNWNNGIADGVSFIPTTTTTYTVTGTTNGCSNMAQTTITVNPLPAVNAGADKTICPGTSTSLTATGAISYSWTGGITNGTSFSPATTTTYVVTGTNGNNCSNKDTVIVNIRNLSIVTITPVICKGVPDTLTAPSGSNYIWKKNGNTMSGITTRVISVKVIGTYTVTYQDSLCGLKTLPAVILALKVPPAKSTIAATKTTLCPGAGTILSGTTGYPSYLWYFNNKNVAIVGATSNTYATSTIGAYYVKALDSFGCRSVISNGIAIKSAVAPIPAFTIAKGTLGSKKLSCSNAGTYQWRLNGSNISGATAKTYTATQSGSYSITVTNTSGCSATSSDTSLTIVYTGPKVSQEELNAMNDETEEDYVVYPNPSTGVYYIQSNETLKAIVSDIDGRVVAEVKNATQINLSENVAGIYILQLFNEEGKLVKTMKLMKQ